MRTAAQRATVPAAAVVIGCALLFSDGSALAPLVWIGAAALLVTALAGIFLAPPQLSRPATVFVACLAGLVVWMGASIVWSAQPGNSWQFTNRTFVYFAFACLGLLAARVAPARIAEVFAALLALVFGWALLAKAVPALYPDYGRVARLRSPVEYWNELALLADVAIVLTLWLASARTQRVWVRVGGVLLLYAASVSLLLTYSRFGIVLAVLASVGWLVVERDRVESIAALVIACVPAGAVFAIALALPGITNDHETHAQRVHDGWIFALVALAGGAVVAGVSLLAARRPVPDALRPRVDVVARWVGLAAALVALILVIVFARRIWDAFTNPVTTQITNQAGRLASASSSNRWTWWQEAWDAFTHHPLGGTGAGTFELTNRLHRTSAFDVAIEPHNTPLQFLSEVGIVGFLLYSGAAVAAAAAIWRRRRDAAATALAIGLAAWLVHMVVDMDWSYVAVCGPLLFVAGALVADPPAEVLATRVRPLLAVGAVALALAGAYSLAAPWLAERELSSSTTAAGRGNYSAALSDAKSARSYDPLSVSALLQQAALESNASRARELYRKAVKLEPLNPETWYELGAFEYGERDWGAAYLALDRSWGLDRHGPAGVHCGLLDRVRPRVTGYGPKCRGSAQAANP